MEDNINVCTYDKIYVENYNNNISKIISDPILLFPESAIVMSADHFKNRSINI